MPDARQFVVTLLTTSLESGLSQDQWWSLLEGIDEIAMETGITDLAERHDHYLGVLR